jgi:hypothetical protein
MELFIPRKKIKSDTKWYYKGYGVIFVDKQENIKPVLDYLIEQDDYWENYPELIKVIPQFENNEVESDGSLRSQMQYVGKTDIDYPEELFAFCKDKKIGILIFSEPYEYND